MSDDSSVDSELAALLDEELFAEGELAAAEGSQPAGAAAPEEQQQSKRPRWSGRTPEPIELDDEDKEFLESIGVDQEGSDSDEQEQTKEKEECEQHPGWWQDMCIVCGVRRPAADPTQPGSEAAEPLTKIRHLHHKAALEVAPHEAARIANEGWRGLIAQKRLVLVLDLDHTLLNTVRDIDLVGAEREAAMRQLEAQHKAMQQQKEQQQQQGRRPTAEADRGQSTQQQQQQQGQEAEQQQTKQEGDPWDDPPSAAAVGAAAGEPAAEAAAAAAAAANNPAAANHDSSMDIDPASHQQQQQQQAPSTCVAAAGASEQQQQQRQQCRPGSSGSNGNSQVPPGFGPQAQLFWFKDKGLWTKIRPGVASFLLSVSRHYELHIYTMGDKGYAGLMADVLDPQHVLFPGRVISAADSTIPSQKDLDVLMADESLVLILDDTEHVWEKHRANLIQVERYHYFGASARLFHADASSPLQAGTDEPEAGGMLDNAAALLDRIHSRVYGNQQQAQQAQEEDDTLQEGQQQQQQQPSAAAAAAAAGAGIRRVKRVQQQQQQQPTGRGLLPGQHGDVRACLEAERRSVLAGCSIVFSRCWPQQQEPADHPLWQLAARLGASCSLGLRPGVTTHLVVAPDADTPAGSVPFTDKVQAAQKAGIPVVHPDWLLACRFAWRQLPAADFSLKTYSSTPGSSVCSRRWLGLAKPEQQGGAAAAAWGGRGPSRAEREAVLKAAGRTGP